MPHDSDDLLARLTAGDTQDGLDIEAMVDTSTAPGPLIAAAVLMNRPALLAKAALFARSTADRHLVTIALAHFDDDAAHLDALVREHLADFPAGALATWIATRTPPPTRT